MKAEKKNPTASDPVWTNQWDHNDGAEEWRGECGAVDLSLVRSRDGDSLVVMAPSMHRRGLPASAADMARDCIALLESLQAKLREEAAK